MSWRARWNGSRDDGRVIIVGAGITGLAASIALQRSGRRVVVLEQSRERVEDVRGIVVTARDAELLDARGLAGEVLRESVPFRERTVDLGSPGPLASVRTIGSPWPRVMPRSTLAAILAEEAYWAGVRLAHGTRVLGAHRTDGGVEVTLADGSGLTAPTLLGADGPASTVRGSLPAAPAHDGLADPRAVRAPTGCLRAGTTPLRVLDPDHRRELEDGASLLYSGQESWFFGQVIDPSEDEVAWLARFRAPRDSHSPGKEPARHRSLLPPVAARIVEASLRVRTRRLHRLPPVGSGPIRLLGSARDGGHRAGEVVGGHSLRSAFDAPALA